MNYIIKNIEDRILKFKFGKIYILFFLMLFFSILYLLLDDSHFEGVNKFKELVKEMIISDFGNAKKDLLFEKEGFNTFKFSE